MPVRRSSPRRPCPVRTARAASSPHLRHRSCRVRAPGRPAASRPPRGRHRLVPDGRARPLRRSLASRRCAARWPPPGSRSRWPPTTCRWCATPRSFPLLDGLRAVVNLDNDDPDSPDFLDPGRIESLLLSPLGGLDASDLRALVRRLRAREKEMPDASARRTSRELLRLAVVEPTASSTGWTARTSSAAGPWHPLLRYGARTLARAARQRRGRALAPVVEHLVARSACVARSTPGGAGARRAHRDLDAICRALRGRRPRRRPARPRRRRPPSSPASSPSRSPPTPSPSGGSAARPSGCSPPTGPRDSSGTSSSSRTSSRRAGPTCDAARRLLGADRIGVDGAGRPDLVPPVTARALLMEERRLFYVACTRARAGSWSARCARPTTTASSRRGSSSRARRSRSRAPGRPAAAAAVARRARRRAAPDRRPIRTPRMPLREAAARRLAALAGEEVGRPPAGAVRRPRHVVGHPQRHQVRRPVRDPERPVPISASMLESILVCPAQWFFEREAGGVSAVHQSANLGQILHALAERVAHGELAAEVEPLMAEVEAVWDRLAFRTPVVAPARARPHPQGGRAVRPVAPRQPPRVPRRRGALPERGRRRRPARPAHRLRRPARDRRRRAGGRRRLQDQPAPRPRSPRSRATSSSPSTSTPSTRAPSTRRPAGPVALRRCRAGAARHPDDDHRWPGCRASPPTTTTVPSVQCCAPAWPVPPSSCAPRPSPRPRDQHCRDCPFVADLPGQGRRDVTVQ